MHVIQLAMCLIVFHYWQKHGFLLSTILHKKSKRWDWRKNAQRNKKKHCCITFYCRQFVIVSQNSVWLVRMSWILETLRIQQQIAITAKWSKWVHSFCSKQWIYSNTMSYIFCKFKQPNNSFANLNNQNNHLQIKIAKQFERKHPYQATSEDHVPSKSEILCPCDEASSSICTSCKFNPFSKLVFLAKLFRNYQIPRHQLDY
jgi:hypothetical protein